MSQAHKGSRLIIQDVTYAVPFESAHYSFDQDATGIQNGNIAYPNSGSVYTMRKNEGKFGGAVAVEFETTNLWTGNLAVYNNYNVPSTLVQTGEKYNGQPIWRLGMTVDSVRSSNLPSFQNELFAHGVYGGILSWVTDTQYTASIYWKPVNKQDVVVGGVASNVAGWSSGGSETLSDGWRRHYRYRTGSGVGTTPDAVYFSFMCPSLLLNETVYIDFCCPQIEMGRLVPSSYIPSGTTRPTGLLTFDSAIIKNSAEGTVSFWYKADIIRYGAYKIVIRGGSWGAGEEGFGITLDYYSNIAYLEFGRASSGYGIAWSDIAFEVNKWYFIAVTWSATKVSLHIGNPLTGVFKTFPTSINFPPLNFNYPISFSRDPKLLATYDNGTGLFDELRIQRTTASDEEVMSWFVSNKPFYNPYDYRGYAY